MAFASERPSSPSSTVTLLLQNMMRYMVFFFGIAALCAIPANAQCPAVGADTTCGVVITIIDIGTGTSSCPGGVCASISNTGQPPYDNIEDTLVGVVNNSKVPIASMVLTSSLPRFCL